MLTILGPKYNHGKYHAVLKDSQKDISEAWETSNFFKIKIPPCSKRYKWSTRANDKLLQKDISEDQWVVK